MRRAAARLCSAMRLLTAFMVSIHLGDCRKCSQHWLHFEPPSLPSPPPCVFCTQAAGRQGQSPWDSCTDVWCLPTMQNRNQNGQGLFDRPCLSKRQRRDTVPHWWHYSVSGRYLQDEGKNQNLFRNMSPMHVVFWMLVNTEMLVCWEDFSFVNSSHFPAPGAHQHHWGTSRCVGQKRSEKNPGAQANGHLVEPWEAFHLPDFMEGRQKTVLRFKAHYFPSSSPIFFQCTGPSVMPVNILTRVWN